MELHHRVELMDTLLEEAAQKRTALTHALHANERAEQEQASTHGAPSPMRRRAYSTNTICGKKPRTAWQRCAQSWQSWSNWNGSAG